MVQLGKHSLSFFLVHFQWSKLFLESFARYADTVLIGCLQSSIFSYFNSTVERADRIARTELQRKTKNLTWWGWGPRKILFLLASLATPQPPACLLLASLAFSFAWVNREAVNSLQS